MEIFNKQKPVSDVIAHEHTDAALKRKLVFIQEILTFAHNDLLLPDQDSYRSYAQLDRNYVVWNIFAAPEFSLQARKWCYLFIGCLSYRGYFGEEKARSEARNLEAKGWDVYIGGVRAYSTLGWFRDPVLDTMLDNEEWEIARLIFHELAHQKIYIKNDVDFNEAFADSLARIGLMRWLGEQSADERERISILLSHEDDFIDLVLRYRQKLSSLYQSSTDEESKRKNKFQILDRLQEEYVLLKADWGPDDRFDAWMDSGVNNAKLSAVATYRRLVPYFINVYEATDKNLPDFYTLVQSLGHCDKETRQALLRKYPVSNINCLENTGL